MQKKKKTEEKDNEEGSGGARSNTQPTIRLMSVGRGSNAAVQEFYVCGEGLLGEPAEAVMVEDHVFGRFHVIQRIAIRTNRQNDRPTFPPD